MASVIGPRRVVRYELEDGSQALFEIQPVPGFEDAAGPDRAVGMVRDATRQALRAATEVLQQVRAHGPQEVEVKFGLKVSGKADWLVASAASEGSFEVTLKWTHAATSGADTDQPDEVPGT
ncbi:CU044_2847 family protein [Dactylosporangium cerinum]|uniref:CU044_2847 family protein n=1 Tax=Dactylosporangium cerinum TaxID=1434730 RepID=A0ABV9WEW3_9ACTN